MPFIGLQNDRPVLPLEVGDSAVVRCPRCDGKMEVRAGETIARHFWHPPDVTPPDGSNCSGESAAHIEMKHIAAEKLLSNYPAAETRIEHTVGTGERRADVCVVFAEPRHPLGRGIAVEVQYRHSQKSILNTTEDYLQNGFSVMWLDERDYDGSPEALEETLSKYVDSIYSVPMSKAELSARVENLLQMREFSRELSEEQQLTELIFESSPLAKLVVEPDRTVVRANERAGTLLDVEPTALVGHAYDDGDWTAVRADGTEIPPAERPLTTVFETGESVYGYEFVLERADRDDIWVSANVAPIRNESGDIIYAVVVLEDITLRHIQAKTLEQQVDLFKKSQDLADVGAWEYSLQTAEFDWTRKVYHILDVPSSVTPTLETTFEQFAPEDRQVLQTAFERAMEQGEPFDLELRVGDEGETPRWVRTVVEPQYENGKVVRLRGSIQDVTDRKEREMELQRMTNAVEEAPIGIVLCDPSQADNPMTYVNEGFVNQTGYTREEALGRNCRFLQGEDTDEATVAKLRRAIDAEEPVSVTIRNYRADGSQYWNRLEVAPVRDDDGTVVNFIGFQQDVTPLVERQRQLQLLDRYLRHNIRNKMNVIMGQAELIQDNGHPPVTDYANTIEQTSVALLGNVEKERQIIKVLRAEPASTRFELVDLLQSMVAELTEEYPDADVSVSGPESVDVTAIPELTLALEELVRNAIEHNDAATPTVELVVETEGDAVRVDVVDDGPGIPEMEVDVLRDADAESAVYHGRGLGLWLVYLVVRHSGGDLAFEERASGGTVVSVTIPTPGETY